jgi:serine acetyltransferase
MLNSEDRALLEAEREALRAYWTGNQDQLFTLEAHDAYDVCEALWPSWFAWNKAMLRYLAVSFANKMPLSSLKIFFYRLLGVKIGRGVWISPGVVIDPLYPWLIELEDGCLLGMGCRIFTHERNANNFRIGRVRVGKGSVIGAYATVRSGVTIGSKVTVGFNSYVNKDVPDGATVGGVPARVLKSGALG